jgi:hypothetical protein
MRCAAVLAALGQCGSVELIVVADEPGQRARAWLAARGATLWATPQRGALPRAARIVRGAATGRSIPALRLAEGRLGEKLRGEILARRPDVVVLGDTFLGEAAPALRDVTPMLVVDNFNVESVLWKNVASVTRTPAARALYSLLATNTDALERRVLPLADRVWTASGEDAAWFSRTLALPRVDVVPNVLPGRAPLAPSTSSEILLSGFFEYPPNEDAALALIGVSQELARRTVGHSITLVGRGPTRRMRTAAFATPAVAIAGEVESMEPWLERCGIFAAPLRAGSGTKFKLLQAMLAGRALVTTPVGASGLEIEHGRHGLVCEYADFASAVAQLLRDPALRERLAAEAHRHVTTRFGQARLDDAVRRSLGVP